MIDLWRKKNIPKERIEINRERFAPFRRKFDTARTVVHGTHDYQCDLMEISQYANFNRKYKYVLVLINAYTKYLRVYPLKNKDMDTVHHAFTELMKDISPNRRMRYLQSDKGKEFINKKMKDFYKTRGIIHYCTDSEIKAAMAERVIRTLRNMINLNIRVTGEKNWIDSLNDIVKTYNNKKHRTIGVTPREAEIWGVTPDITKRIEKIGNRLRKVPKVKYEIGDVVRISKYKRLFEKETTDSNWSNEQYKIVKINSNEYPTKYYLSTYFGEPLTGYYTQHEIRKVKYPGVYLIEKVIKCVKNKCLVKYLGFDSSHNAWLNKKDVI